MATARTVRPDELDELLALYRMLDPDDPALERDEQLYEHWRAILRDPFLEIVVVEHDDTLVSTCALAIVKNLTRGARPYTLIENVVTHEAYRGNGFGTLCVRKAVELAVARDCYKVMLLTGSKQEQTHRFYERCGFDGEEKTGYYLDLRDGS